MKKKKTQKLRKEIYTIPKDANLALVSTMPNQGRQGFHLIKELVKEKQLETFTKHDIRDFLKNNAKMRKYFSGNAPDGNTLQKAYRLFLYYRREMEQLGLLTIKKGEY